MNGERAADVNAFRRVFDGVVEDVEERCSEVFRDAEGMEADGAGNRLEDDAVGREVVALKGNGDAVGEKGLEVEDDSIELAVALA